MTIVTLQLIKNALYDLSSLMPGEALDPNLAEYCLQKLNRIIDNWNAQREAVYVETQATFTITPSLQPHTIGPTGATWTVPQRPVSIEGASVILDGAAPNANVGLNIRDAAWWQAVIAPTVTATLPSDVYYAPAWPNGQLYFWPVPTTAYEVLLQYRVLLSEVTLDSSIALPPGYIDALTLTLTEDLWAIGKKVPDGLPARAMQARARIFANNDVTPRIATQDAGMPSGSTVGALADFNWLNGSVV